MVYLSIVCHLSCTVFNDLELVLGLDQKEKASKSRSHCQSTLGLGLGPMRKVASRQRSVTITQVPTNIRKIRLSYELLYLQKPI